MKLIVENIGMFEKAELNIDGITVIAGENDSGKSTLGKILFSLIKADNIARFGFKTYRINRFQSLINKIIGFLKVHRKLTSEDEKKLNKLARRIIEFLKEKAPRKEREERKRELLTELKYFLQQPEDKQLEKYIQEIENILDDNKAFLISRKRELEKQLRYNFEEDVLHGGCNSGKIIVGTSVDKLYEVKIEKNKIFDFRDFLPKDPMGRRIRPLVDVTLIESPVVMTLVPFFDSLDLVPDEYRKDIKYPNMIRDVIRKLLHEKQNTLSESPNVQRILEFIEKLIAGNFHISENRILFNKKGRKFEMVNVAMGIKSFGIVYLLLKHGYIRDFSTLLIVDEPEVHLHPEWHLAYAKLLVKIHTELGCIIVINTHSPFFVQAVRKYAYESECLDRTNFYFARKKDSLSSELLLVNDNLNMIFESLTYPIEEVIS